MLSILQNKLGASASALSHHAYLLSGPTEDIYTALKELLHDIWSVPAGDPPVVFEHLHDSLGINEGRHLQILASRRGFGDRQYFIIRANTITREAQNALLKLFEEPSTSTVFFLIVRNGEALLPTLRSRFQAVPLGTHESSGEAASAFVRSTITDRLEQVAPLLKEKDTDAARQFVADLARTAHSTPALHPSREVILTAEHCLNSPSPSLKQILEGLAYSLPRLRDAD